MPFDEIIDPSGYKDLALLDSAVNRPFHTFDGNDVYESLAHKGAALFHSLICNHCFENGNKRTGLIALDLFLTANEHFWSMGNDAAYQLATRTAEANAQGRRMDEALNEIVEAISAHDVTFEALSDTSTSQIPGIAELRDALREKRKLVLSHPYNTQIT